MGVSLEVLVADKVLSADIVAKKDGTELTEAESLYNKE